jgi:hypothetical protein
MLRRRSERFESREERDTSKDTTSPFEPEAAGRERPWRHRRDLRRVVAGALTSALVAAVPAGAAAAASASTAVGHRSPAVHHKNPVGGHKKPGPLSGTWSGSYHGSFSGTFRLTWQEIGQSLSGTIMISGLGNAPTSIHGVVHGSSISFGTVGSKSVTYNGSVSGSSMSGSWKISAGGRSIGGGSWSAVRAH